MVDIIRYNIKLIMIALKFKEHNILLSCQEFKVIKTQLLCICIFIMI